MVHLWGALYTACVFPSFFGVSEYCLIGYVFLSTWGSHGVILCAGQAGGTVSATQHRLNFHASVVGGSIEALSPTLKARLLTYGNARVRIGYLSREKKAKTLSPPAFATTPTHCPHLQRFQPQPLDTPVQPSYFPSPLPAPPPRPHTTSLGFRQRDIFLVLYLAACHSSIVNEHCNKSWAHPKDRKRR